MGVFKRTTKKLYKGGKRYLKKRYGLNKKSTGMNLGTLASDVMMLKKVINAEKKYFNYNGGGPFDFGQVNGTSSTGAICYDITPLVSQGLGPDGRMGASIKLCSALYQFQITQQSAVYFPAKVYIDFWINKGQAVQVTDGLNQLFVPSQFSGVIDGNSPRNQDRFSDWQLIRSIRRTVPGDQVASGDLQTITFDVPVKFNRGKGHHIRLVNSLSQNPINDILNGQMLMTVRCSVGNASPANNSTRPVPYANLLNSGQSMRFAYKTWFYDN